MMLSLSLFIVSAFVVRLILLTLELVLITFDGELREYASNITHTQVIDSCLLFINLCRFMCDQYRILSRSSLAHSRPIINCIPINLLINCYRLY